MTAPSMPDSLCDSAAVSGSDHRLVRGFGGAKKKRESRKINVDHVRESLIVRVLPLSDANHKPTKKMTTIKILAIVKAGTTESLMRIPQVTVREDGTLWANNNTMPLTNGSGTLGKDALLPLVNAKAWDKIPADNYMRLGINPGDKECIDEAKLANRYTDNRTEAEKAWDKAEAAYAKAERLQDNGGVSSAIAARMEADKIAAEWAATYPEAAAARKAEAAAEEAARQRRILSSDGYKAALEGRD